MDTITAQGSTTFQTVHTDLVKVEIKNQTIYMTNKETGEMVSVFFGPSYRSVTWWITAKSVKPIFKTLRYGKKT